MRPTRPCTPARPVPRPPDSGASEDKGAPTTRKSSLGTRARRRQADDPQAMFGLAIALEEVGTREADQEADQEADRF